MPRNARVSIKSTTYDKFRGADFSTDPALVDKSRSPLCTNMISDAGGMPEKRCGWRTLHTIEEDDEPVPINGLHYGVFSGTTYRYLHAGTKLYTWDETENAPVVKLTGLHDGKSRSVSLAGKLWIVTGGELIRCSGATVERVTGLGESAYVPTTIITREPTGGGVPYEDVNMATPYRKNAFQTDGSATVFQLDSAPLDNTGTVRVWVWGTETTAFSVDRTNGKITMDAPPAAPAAGSADGLVVQFPVTVSGYADIINKCTIITVYGAGNSDRVVLSGNPDSPNRDYTSALNDPTYFPDLGYSDVGIEGVPIKGYCRIGNYLAIVKEDNGQDSTIFFRSASVDSDGKAVFTLSQAMSGVGAVSAGSFASLLDEPLFLAGTGIFAVTTNYLTGDRAGQNRSYYINARLISEELSEAEGVSYQGMYLLAFPNGHVYILDGRQNKTYRSESLGDYVYECYYWENVPARCWLNLKSGAAETLYFGTEDGRVCRFNTDEDGVARFSDDTDGIDAVWATKLDDDDDATVLKTMIKRGCAVTLKPYRRSSARVCLRTDRDAADWQANTDTIDIFDWEDIDFSRFSFDSNDTPREIFFNTKVKKYKRLQILIRNSEPSEGFGVFGITKHYVIGNFAKR